MLATIGYEKASLDDFVATLICSDVEVLVDVRDRAQSRRPGFSKSALSEAVKDAGIEYIHLRELGDPKAGREAARRGDVQEFRMIYLGVLETQEAKDAMMFLEKLAQQKRICLMCFERNQKECHRKIVSDHLETVLDCKTDHLGVNPIVRKQFAERRVLHTDQGAAAPL